MPEPFGAILGADHGDPAVALELATQAYALAPSITAADALAWAHYKTGDLHAALALVEESLATGAASPALLYRAGVIVAADGQRERASQLLDRALEGVAAGFPLLRDHIEDARAALDA